MIVTFPGHDPCKLARTNVPPLLCVSQTPLVPLASQGTVAYAEGGLGGSPPEKFWIFRLKNARFLSFETPYPMYFHGDATSRGRTILLFFHTCSVCIPPGTTSSRKEAGNWLENLRDSQGTPGCCRALEKKLSTYSLCLSQKLPTVS